MQTLANGAASHKKELSWDQVASGDFPPHEPPTADEYRLERFQHAVTKAAQSLAENNAFPMAPDRVQKAMDLVLTGAVKSLGEGTYSVKSGAHTYQIAGECTCQDAQHRSKYCKHYLAVMIWKKAFEAWDYPGRRPVNGSANGNATTVDAAMANSPVNGSANGKVTTSIPHETPQPQPVTLPAIPDDDCTARHWTDEQPPIVWHMDFMVDGISHGVTVRCDDLQEARAQVKEITAMVKKVQADAIDAPGAAPQAGCPKHGSAKLKPSKHHGGMYCAAKDGETWCSYKAEA